MIKLDVEPFARINIMIETIPIISATIKPMLTTFERVLLLVLWLSTAVELSFALFKSILVAIKIWASEKAITITQEIKQSTIGDSQSDENNQFPFNDEMILNCDEMKRFAHEIINSKDEYTNRFEQQYHQEIRHPGAEG